MKAAEKIAVRNWIAANATLIEEAPYQVQVVLNRLHGQSQGGTSDADRRKAELMAQVAAAREALKALDAEKKAAIAARKFEREEVKRRAALQAEEELAAQLARMQAAKSAAKKATPNVTADK